MSLTTTIPFLSGLEDFTKNVDPQVMLYSTVIGLTFLLSSFLFLAVTFLGNQNNGVKESLLPPFADGAKFLLGHFMEFSKSPLNLMKRCYNEVGSVFTVSMFGKKMTFLIGPTASSAFFQATDKELGQDEVYGFMKSVFGEGVVYDSDPKKRSLQMKRTSQALKSSRLRTYVDLIKKETNDFLSKWGDSGKIDICDALSDLIILTASRCLHGDDVRENLFEEVSKLYNDLDQGIQPISVFFPNAPIAAHRRRDVARKEMVALFSKVIEARRVQGNSENRTDILQVFMDIEYDDGTKITNDEITGLLIALLFAGQHTSSITSSWTALHLANNLDLQERLFNENNSILHGKEVEYDDLNSLDLLMNCIREALRMHPPLIMLMRMARQNLNVTGDDGKHYTIPKGNIVAVSPTVQHRLETSFKNADNFDPDRFGPGREEHKTPFAYAPFGGGIHACIGQQFAFLQIKTIMTVLLSKYKLELATEDNKFPEPNYHAMVIGPTAPCTVKYTKRI